MEDAFFGEQVAQQTLKWLFTWKRPSCDGKYVVITPEGFDAAKDLGVHCLSWVVHFRLTYGTYKHWCLRTLLLSLNVAKWHHFTFLGISSSQLALISDRSCHDNGTRLDFFATSHVLLQ